MSDAASAPERELVETLARLRLPRTATRRPTVSLQDACSRGDIADARAWLAAGADVNEKAGPGSPPLSAAIDSGNRELVELLLEKGADANRLDTIKPPLAAAAERGDVALMERLLAAGAVVEKQGDTAVRAAAAANQLEATVWLGERGAAAKPGGAMPLVDVVRMLGHGVMAKWLDGESLTDDDWKRWRTERNRRDQNEQDLLEALGAAEHATPELAGADRAAEIATVCARIAEPELADRLTGLEVEGDPLLPFAAGNGLTEVVAALLDAGVEADHTERELRFTALMEAAGAGFGEAVALLLARGADPNATSDIGYTALIRAAEQGDPAVVKQLLDAGADPRTRTKAGESAMTNARGLHRPEIARLLRGADAARGGDTRGSGLKVKRRKKMPRTATARGAEHFCRHVGAGQPEWTLMAVRAPADDVADALSVIAGDGEPLRDVADRQVQASDDPALGAFVFQLAGHDWSVLPRTIGWGRLEDVQAVTFQAQALSERLGTVAIASMADDTACQITTLVWDNGERTDTDSFDYDERRFDRLIAEHDLWLPPIEVDSDGFDTALVLAGVRADAVAALHHIRLKAGQASG